MRRDEIREQLEEAILKCRRTARDTMKPGHSSKEHEEAHRVDDEALGEVWKLLQDLG